MAMKTMKFQLLPMVTTMKIIKAKMTIKITMTNNDDINDDNDNRDDKDFNDNEGLSWLMRMIIAVITSMMTL